MPFDFILDQTVPRTAIGPDHARIGPGVAPGPSPETLRRAARGLANFHSGHSAEEAVARHYGGNGGEIAARRWRATGGEVDLIVDDADGTLVFVEVKHAPTHDLAATRIGPSQWRRIAATADRYLARRYGHLDVDMRFDLALVDRMGRVEIVENAYMAGLA
ncbi:YraN family protein [Pseudogemmobacter sonorensis]|uniref:YraN family protein n=1 Tax=Pseudogemmobacter sonorensis TaxID=2989681 RepID=UPI0036A5E485